MIDLTEIREILFTSDFFFFLQSCHFYIAQKSSPVGGVRVAANRCHNGQTAGTAARRCWNLESEKNK